MATPAEDMGLDYRIRELVGRPFDESTVKQLMELTDEARRTGAVQSEIDLTLILKDVLLSNERAPHPSSLMSARAMLQRLSELVHLHPEVDPIVAAGILADSGIVEARLTSVEDPVAALMRAREMLEAAEVKALSAPEGESREELLAHIRSNHGLAIQELCDFDHGSIEDAIDLFEAALSHRSVERDPEDWAFTKLNLGIAVERRKRDSATTQGPSAIDHYRDAAQGFRLAGNKLGESQALYNIGARLLHRVERADVEIEDTRPDAAITSLPDGHAEAGPPAVEFPLTAPDTRGLKPGEQEMLVEALEAALEARDLRAERKDQHGVADCLALAAQISERLGDNPDQFASDAIQAIEPEYARDTVVRAAMLLMGARKSNEGHWARAAAAYQFAADANRARASRNLRSSDRTKSVSPGNTYCRWASYSWLRAGEPIRAAESLEVGSLRELKHSALSAELDSYVGIVEARDAAAATALREALPAHQESIVRRFTGSTGKELVPDSTSWNALTREISHRYQIHPPFEAFDVARFVGTLAQEEAVCVINSSPSGTGVIIGIGGSDTPAIVSVHDSALTSTALADRMFFGNEETAPYIFFTEGIADAGDQIAALSEMTSHLLSSCHSTLQDARISRLIIMPTGPNTLLPWHCLEHGPTRERLIDHYDIRFTPSLTIFEECSRRAETRSLDKALIVADPKPHSSPLPGTRREARQIRRTLNRITITSRVGRKATVRSVTEEFDAHDIIHLACHGRSSFFSERIDSGLSLSGDTELQWTEIAGLATDRAPLVVLSACQTAVVQSYSEIAVQFNLPYAFLAASASAVIASLWPVADDATAVLMTKFYSLLDSGRAKPERCLRDAQLWMRSATATEIRHAVDPSRQLRADLAARSAVNIDAAPYSSVELWAGFVYIGA